MSGPPQSVKVFEVIYTDRATHLDGSESVSGPPSSIASRVTVLVLADSVMGAVDKFIQTGGPAKAHPLGGLAVRYLGDVWG